MGPRADAGVGLGLNAASELGGRNPFERTFKDLRTLERTGKRPSLVFSPMMIEDSRRLLISNLDLKDITTALDPDKSTPELDAPASRSAVEFHRLFPDLSAGEAKAKYDWDYAVSENFQVGTAARMSATFPIISPAVSLPTVPPRRLVDAGYYDNYGVNIVAAWLWKHQNAIRRHTSGVAIVEIRAFPLSEAGLNFAAIDTQTGLLEPKDRHADLFTDATAAVSAPMAAILAARSHTAYYRNGEQIEHLNWAFNNVQPGFFFGAQIELTRPAALNWYLTSQERKAIEEAWNSPKVKEQVDALK